MHRSVIIKPKGKNGPAEVKALWERAVEDALALERAALKAVGSDAAPVPTPAPCTARGAAVPYLPGTKFTTTGAEKYIYPTDDRTCLAACVNPAAGLHHRRCPNYDGGGPGGKPATPWRTPLAGWYDADLKQCVMGVLSPHSGDWIPQRHRGVGYKKLTFDRSLPKKKKRFRFADAAGGGGGDGDGDDDDADDPDAPQLLPLGVTWTFVPGPSRFGWDAPAFHGSHFNVGQWEYRGVGRTGDWVEVAPPEAWRKAAQRDGKLRVAKVAKGGLAQKLGVAVGDYLWAVDGELWNSTALVPDADADGGDGDASSSSSSASSSASSASGGSGGGEVGEEEVKEGGAAVGGSLSAKEALRRRNATRKVFELQADAVDNVLEYMAGRRTLVLEFAARRTS